MNTTRAIKALALFSLCIAAATGTAELLPGVLLSQRAMTLEPRTSATTYRIMGTVVNTTNGKPIAGLTVKMFDDSGAGHPLTMATSNADGTYELVIDRSLLPVTLQQRELQSFIIRVFNSAGEVIKSPEGDVAMTTLTDAHLDFRLGPSEINPENNVVCGYGQDGTMSRLILKLSGLELTEAFRSFSTTGEPAPELSSDQQKLVEELPEQYKPNTCAEGYLSSLASYLDKRGESFLMPQLTQAMIGPLNQEFLTRNFRIRYTTTFPNGVNPQVPRDEFELKMPNGESLGYIRANVKDLPGNKKVHPTQVQEVGLIAEHALKRFKEAPFSLKDPAGKERNLEILIQDLPAAGATDPQVNYIIINNRNSLQQNFGTVPHELFHRVQYEYNHTTIRSGLYGVLREGGARFIEDSFNDDYNRYVFESRAIFFEPAHSLLTPPDSCSTPINYAAALFWKYLAEQNSQDTSCKREPDIGIESYRQVLVSTASGSLAPYDPRDLRDACSKMTRPTSFDEFRYFDDARAELESSETTWGNYLIANYVHRDDSSPGGERRFAYLEDQDPVMWPFTYWEPGETPVNVSKLAKLGAAIKPYNDLKISTGSSVSRTVIGQLPYAATYYLITPDTSSPPRMLRVSLSAFGGMNDPLIQILSFDRNGVLSDIVRSDHVSYFRTINFANLSSVVVIVASRMAAGDYTLQLDEREGGPDPMITRWNSEKLTEYETDQRKGAWEFKSADLTTNDGTWSANEVAFGVDNKLYVRLHNRGNARIEGVQVELQYQPNRRRIDPTLWEPIHDASNAVQTISDPILEAAGNQGDSERVGVNWAPTTASNGWCVKARIIAPEDLNNDNNVAIGCFARSIAGSLRLTRR